jgi:hypothetical protein
VFFYRFCTDLVAECFIPPITSMLMSRNIWIPLVAAVICQGFSVALSLAVPETLPTIVAIPALSNHNTTSTVRDADEEPSEVAPAKDRKNFIQRCNDSFSFITGNPTVAALVLTFMISKIGRQSLNILLLYVSKRYGWSLAKVCVYDVFYKKFCV